MIPASASPRVLAWLRTAPDGPLAVVHRGADATYVEVSGPRGRRCVGLLGRRAVAVPCGLVTDLPRLDVTAVALRDGTLLVDGEPVVVGRLRDVTVPRLALDLPSPTALPAGVAVGRGDGLTPYDDDVLCGWLAVHRAAGVPTPAVDRAVRAQLHRTTLLSATLLEHALEGEVLPAYAAWLRALGTPGERAAEGALAAVGGSSGRGLLRGARVALSSSDLSSSTSQGAA